MDSLQASYREDDDEEEPPQLPSNPPQNDGAQETQAETDDVAKEPEPSPKADAVREPESLDDSAEEANHEPLPQPEPMVRDSVTENAAQEPASGNDVALEVEAQRDPVVSDSITENAAAQEREPPNDVAREALPEAEPMVNDSVSEEEAEEAETHNGAVQEAQPDIQPEPMISESVSEDDPTASDDTQKSPKRDSIAAQNDDVEEEDDEDDDPPPKKQKPLSSLTTLHEQQALEQQQQTPVTNNNSISKANLAPSSGTAAKKSKKKNNNVWVSRTTRKGKKGKLKGQGVPTTVLKCAPKSCNIYVVSRHKVITNSANTKSTSVTSTRPQMLAPQDFGESSCGFNEQSSDLYTSSVEARDDKNFGPSFTSEISYPNSYAVARICSSTNGSVDVKSNCQNSGDSLETNSLERYNSTASTKSEQLAVLTEMEQLQLELQATVSMYKRACEELVHAQNKVHTLSHECLEERRRVNAALERNKTLRKIASEAKEKHLQALKEVEDAKHFLVKEAYDRKIAELNVLKESLEKQKIVDALLLNDGRYRRYTRDEIEVATDFFSEFYIIGEGGYGKVYKCSLDHTPVAVKVVSPDAVNKEDEFLKEVEVLSQIRHPHVVLLLGACPEINCLVYEYLENGSLEDYIYHQNGKPALPWFVRFQIIFEVACGLAFLHNSKPEPIVHRDLKPGNILLDRNYVSKIGDVGLAKLISDAIPDNITEYRETILAGTLHYMDPEYHRTGTIRPKSDLYAFGVIILQLLTSCLPNGVLLKVESAIKNGSFADILDKSITDWPLAETEELACIALKCSNLRCRDRPDLDTEVMPVLRKLKDVADACVKLESSNVYAPSHFFCPILQEVMEDPYIAADGFTYEHRAIKAWLEKHNVSPVTKLRLQHLSIIPNYTLRSAIQQWRSPVTSL